MTEILRNPRYFKLTYQILLVGAIAQQIYYPQEYKYVHLALVFVRMILAEAYTPEYRYQKHESLFAGAIVVTIVISAIEGIFELRLGPIYLIALAFAVVMLMLFIKRTIDWVGTRQADKMFHPKHIQMLQKSTTFTNGILYVLIGTCVLILVFVLLEFIKLF